MRRKIVGSSWKMHINTRYEVERIAREIRDLTKGVDEIEMFIFPTFPIIEHLSMILKGSNIGWGAQNMSFVDYGAFTGEVPAPTLVDLGCKYVELGHAERRGNFNETDQNVNQKVKLCFKYNMTPLVCVGESKQEKDEGVGHVRIKTQVLWALDGLNDEEIRQVIIAYEPVWAIGQQEGASAEYVENTHRFIRSLIADEFGNDVADAIRIIYGGSVKLESSKELIKKDNIDGLFLGRFALTAENYAAIVKVVVDALKRNG
ncbi:MAG: triose-phosphate isomerase [Erysipelotrichales bacterium]|nr:MAG: triose-phosphate isomerase [Erysipelotrichales bacterium]